MSPATGGRLANSDFCLRLLLTLAAVQFTHIVDFMIMMPLCVTLAQRIRVVGDGAAGKDAVRT